MLDDQINVSYPDGMGGGRLYLRDVRPRAVSVRRHPDGRFTEEDVAAGKIVTPESRLRILVNSSGGTGSRLPGEMTEPPKPPAVAEV